MLANCFLGTRGPLVNVRLVGGHVASVGQAVPRTAKDEVIDLEGKVLLPGLWDAHVHSGQWATARHRLDVSAARSAREVGEFVARHMSVAAGKSSGPRGLVIAYGFRDGLWQDHPQDIDLQAFAPGVPLVLLSNDLHTGWFSPAALELVGEDPRSNGLLREHECFAAVQKLPSVPSNLLDEWVAQATTSAAQRGVTGILDFEHLTEADNVTAWLRRIGNHRIDVRVTSAVHVSQLDAAIGRGLRTGSVLPDGRGLLAVGPVKFFLDGSLNTRTAYCYDAYPDSDSNATAHGWLEISPSKLELEMRKAVSHGLEPALHAIGDHANSMALDAFESVGCRGRIEHAQLVRREDLRRFARPGLIVGIQPAHAPDDRDVADRFWAGRTDRSFPYADLLAAGAKLEIGSDAPVAPMDPWDGIAAAVFRSDDERPAWHPEQSIPVEAALQAACRGRFTVQPGDVADLVIVEKNPLHLESEELRRMPVFGTLLGGRWTYRKESRS